MIDLKIQDARIAALNEGSISGNHIAEQLLSHELSTIDEVFTHNELSPTFQKVLKEYHDEVSMSMNQLCGVYSKDD